MAVELLRQFGHWSGQELPEQQLDFLDNLEAEIQISRLRRGISPAKWERISGLRDAVLPR